MPAHCVTSGVGERAGVAEGAFAPGHLGELTQIVPFEMVDAVLDQTRAVQRRVRALPSRVVVYVLVAAALFAEYGYRQVWAKLVAGLDPEAVAAPSAAALAAARRRIGPAPLAELFGLLATPAAGPGTKGAWWRGRLVCALDGTMMCCPDTPANLVVHRKGGGHHGGTGYPMIRLLALVACGTRTLLAATFGPTTRGETRYALDLLPAMGPGMIVLGDRNFAAADLIAQIAATGAEVLIRVKTGRTGHKLPVCGRFRDGSYLSQVGPTQVRVIDAAIIITTEEGRRRAVYRLITTVLDPDCSAEEIVRLYHQRWEIETTYCELKSTILGGRVLRARTPAGVEQEVYALLIAYQAIRIAIADTAIARPDLDPDRASFTIALNTARDQIIKAAGIIAQATEPMIDIVGVIGRQVLADLLPPRRSRSAPRVVKRAISNYAPHTASRRLRGPSHDTTTRIDILTGAPP